MAVTKPRLNVTTSLNVLIYILTFFGMLPFSMLSYYRHKILKASIFTNIYLVLQAIHGAVQFHYETVSNAEKVNKDSGRCLSIQCNFL